MGCCSITRSTDCKIFNMHNNFFRYIMDLLDSEKKLIWDYIFFHYHSPLNTRPDDYRRFNYIMFRGIKLNFLYTTGLAMSSYYILIGRKNSVLRGYTTPGYIALGLTVYSLIMFYSRMQETIYSQDSLKCALIYEKEVFQYNDHFHRLFGNSK